MVYIELNGRIGNHLFQIAAGISYAKKHGMEYTVITHDGYKLAPPDNCYIKDYIKQFNDNILRNVTINGGRPSHDCYYYYETEYTYKEIPVFDRDILLYGAFQSEKYFDSELVRELFSITPAIKEYIYSKYGNILEQGVTAINVRRGDYCKQPHKYMLCSMDYYKKAIEYIGKDKKFLVISDDIKWCKKEFLGDNFYFVDDEEPIIDLYIQTLCENNIISNSTFSWWGAWLNPNPGKTVVCPDHWFGRFYKYSTQDLIPTDWIQLENKLSSGMELKASLLMGIENMKKLAPQSLKNKIKKALK
ncbi:hypothetical protein M2132_001637 [Dysgonomonas sp. PH5-45]|uniref:alpha-1,2-fucosyltransferase n=1 Tax=unclassified Dysgonomonas TaxID=2630389 RepID=UPI00247466D8|nr:MULTISPECIES: alpha-1,2-fucosyltransferase [unclassified Dysgonomonas]MDH6355298.1 hypothetical protein [Dysgonomonas sp. PH5-45]MDH6388176.1 hypothetical protein [Dysgonomonas sp. PH5-37]